MFTSAFVSTLWLAVAGGTPVQIADAAISSSDERLSLWIRTSSELDSDDLRGSISGEELIVTVDGARLLRPLPSAINAEGKRGVVTLRAAIPNGVACPDPVRFRRTSMGYEAFASCRPAPPPPPVAAVVETPKPTPEVQKPVATRKDPVPASSSVASESASPWSAAAVLLLLCAIGAVLFLLGRKRRDAASLVEMLHTQPMGPRRSLSVARVAGKLFLLSNTDAGIQLIAALDDDSRPGAPAATKAPVFSAPAPAPSFDALLADADEATELRRKLDIARLQMPTA